MASFAYLFEAKGIQRYILDGGRLRDLVGASELIDSLARYQQDDINRLRSTTIGEGAAFLADAGKRNRSERICSGACFGRQVLSSEGKSSCRGGPVGRSSCMRRTGRY